jgi:hypothetical protein
MTTTAELEAFERAYLERKAQIRSDGNLSREKEEFSNAFSTQASPSVEVSRVTKAGSLKRCSTMASRR